MNLLKDSKKIRFVDLFCGLGGFRVAIEQVCRQQNLESDCVFSCDIDKDARAIYHANFGDKLTLRPHKIRQPLLNVS